MKSNIICFILILLTISNTLKCSTSRLGLSSSSSSYASIKNNMDSTLLSSSTSTTSSYSNLSTSTATATTAKKKRFTQDGRTCASAFVQDGQTFFDCTKSRSPDGSMSHQEWCYVENPENGVKSWDYCIAIMDYDQLRKHSHQGQHQMTLEVNKLNREIQSNIQPAQETFTQLGKLKNGQLNLSKKINEIFKTLSNISKSMQKLQLSKNALETYNDLIKDLQFKIDKIKDNNGGNLSNQTDNQSDKDISSKLNSHETIISTNKAKTNYCKGMMNYEDEEQGDGLIGKYYDNEIWVGSNKERLDREIDFDWTGGSPIKGINPNNFSIKWSGYLLVPYSGYYNFIIKADDGVELVVNNEVLLRKKLSNDISDDLLSDIGKPAPMDDDKITSSQIYLRGGLKVRIICKYFHSIHNDLVEDGQVSMQLNWASSEFREVLIPQKYLYSSNDFPPLKVSNFANTTKLSKLYENNSVFINSSQYILQDIPLEYKSATCLKFNTLYKNSDIKFHINTPSIVYIAVLSHYPNPLPEEFEDTGYYMSILQIDLLKKSSNAKRIVARKSSGVKIYKNSYGMGDVTVKLNKTGINKQGIPMIVFFGFDSKAIAPLSCLGKSTVISNPSGDTFKSCKSSSYREGYNCEAGFSENMRDENGGVWASMNEGIGAWIYIEFNSLFEISQFEYKNRKNPAERNKSLELEFSNGRKQKINLSNSDEVVKYKIQAIRANSVKITILDVYGTVSNGGAFRFSGVKCSKLDPSKSRYKYLPNIKEFTQIKVKNPGDLSPLFHEERSSAIIMSCFDSVTNTHKFDSINTDIGSKILIKCPESCAKADENIYGGGGTPPSYTVDSIICKSAFHAGKISSAGGLVKLAIKPGERNYLSISKSGVKSLSKAYSRISISYEDYNLEDNIVLKNGSKVDVNISGSTFYKGVIRDVKIIDKNHSSIKVDLEGGKQVNYNYPTNEIRPCGTHFTQRDCGGSVKNYVSHLPIKIRFVTKDTNVNGEFLPDYGGLYGSTGKPFGFSRSLVDQIITRGNSVNNSNNNNKPELETFVKFPPSPLSNYCVRPSPDENCEPVLWSVWTGKGKFKVKLFIGDSFNDIYADFSVNGKIMCKSQKVLKGNLDIIEEKIESKAGYITIRSECVENCKYAMSKLNAVELTPIGNDIDEGNDSSKTEKLKCGNNYIKGKCEKGPDVTHCIFEDKTMPSAAYCSGGNSLVTIPDDYKCKEQVGKYKCVKIEYDGEEECKLNCPKKCKAAKCLY